MRWEDERYVKSYTRDTVNWLGLSFEAQGLQKLLERKVDGAGILDLGGRGEAGVAIAIGHPTRSPTIIPALRELLAIGTVVIERDRLVIPKFVEAQSARASDAARKRLERERAKANALKPEDVTDSPPDPPDGRGADRHTESRVERSEIKEERDERRSEPASPDASAAADVPPPGESVDAQVIDLEHHRGQRTTDGRRLSAQEVIAGAFEERRRHYLGDLWRPDQAYSAKAVNGMLKDFVKAKIPPDVAEDLTAAFFADEHKRELDPPCPLWAFGKDFEKYRSRVMREAR